MLNLIFSKNVDSIYGLGLLGSVGSMPLQFLEIGFHVEIHAIEWHDFQHETQFHGVVVA